MEIKNALSNIHYTVTSEPWLSRSIGFIGATVIYKRVVEQFDHQKGSLKTLRNAFTHLLLQTIMFSLSTISPKAVKIITLAALIESLTLIVENKPKPNRNNQIPPTSDPFQANNLFAVLQEKVKLAKSQEIWFNKVCFKGTFEKTNGFVDYYDNVKFPENDPYVNYYLCIENSHCIVYLGHKAYKIYVENDKVFALPSVQISEKKSNSLWAKVNSIQIVFPTTKDLSKELSHQPGLKPPPAPSTYGDFFSALAILLIPE